MARRRKKAQTGIRMLGHRDQRIRRQAIAVLAAAGQLHSLLIEALYRGTPAIRAGAAEALGRFGARMPSSCASACR